MVRRNCTTCFGGGSIECFDGKKCVATCPQCLNEQWQKVVETLFEEMICPMCYRLNPQHASMDNGMGCKSCQDKIDYCGEEKADG